jgi:hypothetical protein
MKTLLEWSQELREDIGREFIYELHMQNILPDFNRATSLKYAISNISWYKSVAGEEYWEDVYDNVSVGNKSYLAGQDVEEISKKEIVKGNVSKYISFYK